MLVCTGYLYLEDVDHPKRPPNDKIQTNHRTDPIFGMDGPQRSSTGPTEAIFGFCPLSRIIGIGLRYPQVKKIGNFLDNSAQGSKSKNRLGRPSSGSLVAIHAKDGVCVMISLDFIIWRPFWGGPHLLNRGILYLTDLVL